MLEKIPFLTMEEAWDAIKTICEDLGYNPKQYLIFKEVGGFDWVLDKLASDFFMSMKPVDTIVRNRMACLHVAYFCNDNTMCLFKLNSRLKEEKDPWERGCLEKKIKKCRAEYSEKVKTLE